MSENEAPRVVWLCKSALPIDRNVGMAYAQRIGKYNLPAIIIDDATRERWKSELVSVRQMVATLPSGTLASEIAVKVRDHYLALLEVKP